MITASVITGQVRNEKSACVCLSQLISLREKGLLDYIVFSTWDGELGKHPNFFDLLVKNNIYVIENSPQEQTLQASHQKIPLAVALDFLPEDAYVTRHRFDRVLPDYKFEGHLSLIKEKGPEKVSNSCLPFKNKLTVNSALIDVPFFLNDLIFSGINRDLMALVDVTFYNQLYVNNFVNQELLFFASCFTKQFPEIKQYLATYPGLTYNSQDRRDVLRKVQIESEYFAYFFSLYVYIVNNCFNIGYDQTEQEFGLIKIEDLMLNLSSHSGLYYFEVAGHSFVKSNSFFKCIYNHAFPKSKFSELVYNKLSSFEDIEPKIDSRPFFKLTNESIEYANKLRELGMVNQSLGGYTETLSPHHFKVLLNQSVDNKAKLAVNTSFQEMFQWDKL